jgi:aminotransferase
MAGFYHLKCVEIPRKADFSINLEEIKKKITPKTKFLLINTPNNPTGYVYTKKEMDAVVQLVIENDLYLISDEVYEKFLYGNRTHYSPASYPGMENRTITMNAMSKTFGGPGLRLGYIAAPEAIVTEMEKYSQYTSAGTSHPTQYGAIAAMKFGNPEMPKIVERYDKKRLFCTKRLKELGFEVVEPFGAFYIMPKVTPFEKEANIFSTKLMKEVEVAVVPGADFGSYSNDMIRISYATEDAKIEEGFNRIERFLKKNYK